MKLSEYKQINKFMGLFKGPSGSGKTIGWASFPGKILVYDIDKRLKPILKFYKNDLDDLERRLTIEPVNDLLQFMTHFENIVNSPNNGGYDLVVIDGLTFLADQTILFARNVAGGKKGKDIGGIWIPGLEEFGAESALLTRFILGGKQLKCHFILTAHLAIIDIKALDGSITNEYVLVTGGKKVGAKLPGLFDEEYYFTTQNEMDAKKEAKRIIWTGPTGLVSAKTALNLPKWFEWTNKNLYQELVRLQGGETSINKNEVKLLEANTEVVLPIITKE